MVSGVFRFELKQAKATRMRPAPAKNRINLDLGFEHRLIQSGTISGSVAGKSSKMAFKATSKYSCDGWG